MITKCKVCGREELKVKMIPRIDKTYICQDCMYKHLNELLAKNKPGGTLYKKIEYIEMSK